MTTKKVQWLCGIDPGLSGGVCMLRRDNPLEIRLFPMPVLGKEIDTSKLVRIFDEFGPVMIFLEKVSTFHKASATASFTFGQVFGKLVGIIETLEIPYDLILPAIWTRLMFQGLSKHPSNKKHQSAMKFGLLYPHHKEVDSDGLWDAALIAHYGYRVLLSHDKN